MKNVNTVYLFGFNNNQITLFPHRGLYYLGAKEKKQTNEP